MDFEISQTKIHLFIVLLPVSIRKCPLLGAVAGKCCEKGFKGNKIVNYSGRMKISAPGEENLQLISFLGAAVCLVNRCNTIHQFQFQFAITERVDARELFFNLLRKRCYQNRCDL